jgi:DNA-binding CsgD family transcriptional regulator
MSGYDRPTLDSVRNQGALVARNQRNEAADEVTLHGELAEFRIALREEIEAARRATSSSAVSLVNGRRIGRVGFGHQYLFTIESALNLPDGAPGDLLIAERQPAEATVISIDGLSITLSLSADAGEFIPRARLQSSLVHLLRKLIERIEDLAEQENPAGARLLGQRAPQGAAVYEPVDELNAAQAEAVASALGRDTTFIWGPPGTGKTKTIGTIGELLWQAERSVLLVSHTNAAVDQALLHIADALGPQAEDGSVLRVGAPKDLRLFERPKLLAETHIKERSEVLEREEEELRSERRGIEERVREAQDLIALATWLAGADVDVARLRALAVQADGLARSRERLERELAPMEEQASGLAERVQAARAVEGQIEREQTLANGVSNAESRATDARSQVEAAETNQREARKFQEQVDNTGAVGRRLRRLPGPEEQAAVVASTERELTSARERLDRGEYELRSLKRQLNEVREVLTSFAATHGDSPDAVLAAAREFERELGEKRRAVQDARKTDHDVVAGLESETSDRWALLSNRSLVGQAPASIHERIQAMDDARPAASIEVGGRDPVELQAEITRLNELMRAIVARLKEIAAEKSRIEDAVIADARVVATTLTRAYLRDSIQNRRFDTVILDEASMAPIPALWVAAATAERNVVLVGDFRQLPPIKHSEHPYAERWLGQDIFKESGVRDAYEKGRPPAHLVVLQTQYRMHPQISAVPNELIYDGLLADGEETSDDSELDEWFDRDWGADHPVLLVDTGPLNAWVTGVGGGGRTSRLNFLSATVCVDLAERLLRDDRPELPAGSPRRVLIAAPYRPHARLMEMMLQDLELDREVVAGTAHTFQGSEAPVVIFDLVNDEPHWRVGMFDPKRDESTSRLLNVALTRPRHRLIIVGDFTYVGTKGRQAFLGRLVNFLEQRYPKVDARELVAVGLAARAAKAQLAITGGPIESEHQRLVVTQDNFYALLSRDLAAAAGRIVIYSPFITANRLGQLEPQLKAAVERGVRIHVVTKTIEERGEYDQGTYRGLEEALGSWGIDVIHKRQMHEKLVFIDTGILWSGSLNPLSFSATQEVMERRASERVVADYAQALRLEELVALSVSDDSDCPICGSALAMAEGPAEPYWRCPSADCDYTRNIGQPAPRDGLVVCASSGCGKPVKFGFWGEEPRWRCTANSRHRQRIAKSHLKLPKMRALVPRRELRDLDRRFGLDGRERTPGGSPPRRPVDATQPAPSTEPRSSTGTQARNGRLTPREQEILRLLAAHWSRREIAEKLGLSSETVKTYLRDLYRKLGVHDRAAAVRHARRKGWL